MTNIFVTNIFEYSNIRIYSSHSDYDDDDDDDDDYDGVMVDNEHLTPSHSQGDSFESKESCCKKETQIRN